MSALLVITTGQTDVQFVKGNVRQELSKRNCASLHDEIERREGEWRLVDSPPSKAADAVESLPQGAFDLCAPKLDAVLQYAKDKQITLTSALILETRRDAQAAPGDPRYVGAVLATRLREYGIIDVRQMPFLTDQERLEGCEPRDSIIRHEVVDRIEGAVGKAVEDLCPAQILVATTGGFPVVANLVEEIVRLYAAPDGTIELLEAPDGAEGRAVSRQRVPEPAASYQARRHARDLIEKGNLLGAWGAVQHLHHDAVEQRWTRVVEWLGQFAASLPVPEACDIGVLKHEHMSIKAALRVELALRASDIPRAVHGTVAFFESALWDHLKPRLTRHDDPRKHRLYKVDPAPADCLIRKEDGSAEDRKRPFGVAEETDGGGWYRIFDDDVCGIRLAKHYLQQKALQQLGQAVSKIRELRNDVAHNEPTSELMNEARAKMVAASLWSQNSEFLAMPLVQCVLRGLGEQHPDRLCTDLVSTVRSRLLRPSPL
jgi:hypothetical protein